MGKKLKDSCIDDLGIRSTENSNIFVSILPKFTRANKHIGNYKIFIANNELPENTPVLIRAFSTKTGQGEMKNNTTTIKDGIACFEDIRFIGKSGRGNLYLKMNQ